MGMHQQPSMYAHSEVRRAQTFDTRNQDFGHRAQGPPGHRAPAQTFHPQQHHPQQHHPQQHQTPRHKMPGGFPAVYTESNVYNQPYTTESNWQRRPASGRPEEMGVQSHLAHMPARYNDSQWKQHETLIDNQGRRVYCEPDYPMPQPAPQPAPQARVLPLGSHHDSSGRLGEPLGGNYQPQPVPNYHSAPARPMAKADYLHIPPKPMLTDREAARLHKFQAVLDNRDRQGQCLSTGKELQDAAHGAHELALELDQAFLEWKARVGKLADHSVQGRGKSRQVSSRIGLVGCCGSKDKAIDHDWHNNEFNTATHQPTTGLGCCGTKDKFAHHPQHQKDFKDAM